MRRYLKSNVECLNLKVKAKDIEKKGILIEIYIKNNNKFDVFDIELKSNIPTCFKYKAKTLHIEELPFYDLMGISSINIDSLYEGEEIKISYELEWQKEDIFSYIDIEFIFSDNNEFYREVKTLKIDKKIFEDEIKEEKRLKVVKKAKSDTAIISEIISYEIVIENISETFIKNIEIVDIQKKDIEIIGECIYLNNKEIDIASLAKGVYFKYLEKNQKIYIRFKAKVLDKSEEAMLYNIIRVSYEYNLNGIDMYCTEEFESEKIRIYNVNLDIKKVVNKDAIALGEELEFRIDIENNGETDCYGISLYEILSEEVEFIAGSFYKAQENINIGTLENGINIGNLLIGERLTLYYRVLVRKICSTGYINSQISAEFKYKCDSRSPIKFLRLEKKEFKIEAINPGFVEFEIENIIDTNNTPIEIIDITQNIEIEEKYIVKTATGTSIEGITMNLYKLVVVGYLTVYIEYSEAVEGKDVYVQKDRQKFIESIVLSHDYKIGAGINIRSNSINIYLKKFKNGKILYKNSNIVEAIVKEV